MNTKSSNLINIGQKESTWTNFWEELSPESEIHMWDFYGLRPWILKYTPRYGQVCEAGCGLGRYVFYLNRLGVDIEGLDFEENIIDQLNEWKINNGFDDLSFTKGDVTDLPYEDNCLSGYISLGVVEHFVEGPQKAIEEAYRVLRPGGIAIITTPSISWYNFYRDYLKRVLKELIKKIISRKIVKPEFFQYWYRPKKLKSFVEQSGLRVVNYSGADLLYSFIEAKKFKFDHWTERSLPVKFAYKLENTILANIGAQSITISVKVAEIMYCFFCGELKAIKKQLEKYDVPICFSCEDNEVTKFYRKKVKPRYHAPYKVFRPIESERKRVCEITSRRYLSDKLFEDYGFAKNVSPDILRDKYYSILLSNTAIQPVLRKRK
jgi:ubiquinone/menaquinone biosynthesis C-methylase UbiE